MPADASIDASSLASMKIFLSAWLVVSVAAATDWPAFLGSGAGPRQAENLPLEWSPADGTAWVANLPGHGQSSPVTWGDNVFVTSVSGPNKDTYHVSCLDAQSGQIQWMTNFANSVPAENSYYVSRAAPTPVVDADGVVVFFESGDCVALSHEGETLWRRNLAADEGPFIAEFGLGASPCATSDAVFVLLEHDGPSSLVAIEKTTGQTRWKANRKPARSWSSPAIVEVDGSAQVVVSSGGSLDGYDPRSGEKLWSYTDIGGNTSCTPIDLGDGRFLVGASPGRSGENEASAAKSNCLMQIRRADDGFQVEKKWIADGANPTWASPIMHQGLAYWINRAGVVYCFDGQTGEKLYSERTKQSCWATPFAVDDRIYLFGKDGLVTVIAAGREFRVLSENECWTADSLPAEEALAEAASEERRRAAAMFRGPTLYGYAVTDNAFLIRVGNALLAIRK